MPELRKNQGTPSLCLEPCPFLRRMKEAGPMQTKTGVMLCGHGSRDEDAVQEFAVLARHLKQRFPDQPVEFGYLEFATPIIRDGLDRLRAEGVDKVLAVPGMLF